MAEAAPQSRVCEPPAVAENGNSRIPDRDFIALHQVPRRPVSFVSEGRQANGAFAVDYRLGSMKKARATLDRVLSKAGIASRTTTRDWILQGRVKVNGRIIRDPDHWIESAKDVVHLDGLKVRDEKKLYVALNKPTGVVTSFVDNKNRPTVYEYLKELDRWVFPIGRLDMDTSGLLLLTNDTGFGEALLQPESKVPKTYYGKVSGMVTVDEYFRLAYGLEIGRGETTGP